MYVAWRSRSLLLGLSWLCFFHVSSATLAAFAHARLLNASFHWFTSWHADVVAYSVVGCLAMLGGMTCGAGRSGATVAWRRAEWLNARFGGMLFIIGVCATGLLVMFRMVPTVNTGLDLLTRFRELGLLVLLVHAVRTRSYAFLIAAAAVYIPISIAGALASGHTPAKVELLVPAACVVAGFRSVRMRTFIMLAAAGALYYILFAGWLGSRDTIRSGELADLEFTDAAGVFLQELFATSQDVSFEADSVNERLRERIDMTDILAAQRGFQPAIQPYVYGWTFVEAGVALIPRVLWPSKPAVAGGSAFVERFTGIQRPTEDPTSVGLPYPFELYANAGIIGVIVGLFAVGYGCVRLERRLLERAMPLSARLGGLAVLLTLTSGGQRMDVVMPSLVAGAISAWVLGKAIEIFVPKLALSVQAQAGQNTTDRGVADDARAAPSIDELAQNAR
jgi:hypothetical protein